MFIKTLVLDNFQSHEKSIFNFDKGLNVLVGVSNTGKSSVSRALSLVLFNVWDKSWVKFGAKYCRISLSTDTGVEVVREKGEKVNRYILRLPGQPDQLFESFGTNVPEQIQQAFHIHAVQIDTTDTLNLNLAGQMDSLFLLSQTGSYRAKVLGKLSGATYLDHAIRELNKDKRHVTAEKNLKDEEIIGLQAQVDKLASIEVYSTGIAEFDARLISLAAAEQRVERIRNLFERVKVLKDAWIRETKKSELLGPINLDLIKNLTTRVDTIRLISSLLSRVANFKQAFLRETKLNEVLNLVDLSGINRLVDKVSTIKTKLDIGECLQNKINQVVLTISTQTRYEDDYQKTVELYTRLLRENGICPTCNQATNHF